MDFIALIRALEHRDHLSDAEKAIVENLTGRRRRFGKNQEIVAQGSRPTESCLIISGLAARIQHVTDDGKRQITALHIAGDFVDLHSLLLKTMDHSVTALAPCEVLLVPHQRLIELTLKAPHLGRLFWLMTLIDAAMHRAWMASLGNRTVPAQIAHLVCEMYLRMQAVGLAGDRTFDFRVTQQELGDMLGLSTVHVNRSIRELRATGLLGWKGKTVSFPSFQKLVDYAEFDPTYLNLNKEPR